MKNNENQDEYFTKMLSNADVKHNNIKKIRIGKVGMVLLILSFV